MERVKIDRFARAMLTKLSKKTVVKVKGCERPRDGDVSGHSLRVGTAQDLLIRGYDLAAIMRAGGWSDASTVSRTCGFRITIFGSD